MLLLKLLLILSGLLNLESIHLQIPTESPVPADQPEIITPFAGQVLQGLIPVRMTVPAQTISAELSFGYESDPRNTWFLIKEFASLDGRDLQADWDTTVLTDDNFTLRLLVRTDKDTLTVFVPGLRVRNYTSVETDTPLPAATEASEETPSPSATLTTTSTSVPPTVTPLPPNPAQISTRDILTSAGEGLGAALLIFLLLGIYRTIYQIRSRR